MVKLKSLLTYDDIDKLLGNNVTLDNAVEFWNMRSKNFGGVSNENLVFPDEKMFELLSSRNFLNSDYHVLDVGCGIGRHSIGFSKFVGKYTGVDISDGMLERANQIKTDKGLKNVNFINSDWQESDEKYDIVFASMCPAIDSVERVKKFSEISSKYCIIQRFMSDRDNVCEVLGIEHRHNAHNNPDYIYGLVNLLWLEGYYPEILIYDESVESVESTQSIIDSLSAHFSKMSEGDIIKSKEKLKDEETDGLIRVKKLYKKAVIVWDVTQRKKHN